MGYQANLDPEIHFKCPKREIIRHQITKLFPHLFPKSSSRHQLQQDGLLPLRGGRQLLAGLLHADLNEASRLMGFCLPSGYLT